MSKIPGAIVTQRIFDTARSRAIGSVIPTMPPLEAEYAAWPIWPSKAATEAVLTITPRSSPSGSLLDMAEVGLGWLDRKRDLEGPVVERPRDAESGILEDPHHRRVVGDHFGDEAFDARSGRTGRPQRKQRRAQVIDAERCGRSAHRFDQRIIGNHVRQDPTGVLGRRGLLEPCDRIGLQVKRHPCTERGGNRLLRREAFIESREAEAGGQLR